MDAEAPVPDRPPRVLRLVVDRWEGDLAVVETEDGRVLDLPEWVLPPGTREGHSVRVEAEVGDDGSRRLTLSIDLEASEAGREAAEAVLRRLRARDPGGDIVL